MSEKPAVLDTAAELREALYQLDKWKKRAEFHMRRADRAAGLTGVELIEEIRRRCPVDTDVED